MHERRPRLTPAIADVRRAVRETLAATPLFSAPNEGDLRDRAAAPLQPRGSGPDSPSFGSTGPLVLVALSGGPDSLALAAAAAFEAPRCGMRAGAVIVDHALQQGSAEVATRAAEQARELGLDPVIVTRVVVGDEGGPEAAARDARYRALGAAATDAGAAAILLGHTLDDQAETVLLGLARGSGLGSLKGMARASTRESGHMVASEPHDEPFGHSHSPAEGALFDVGASTGSATGATLLLRPLLGIRRTATVQFCADSGLEPWHDPHNGSAEFRRVRVRRSILPLMEAELGPGVAEALARTAEQAREDSDALDLFAEEQIEELAEHAEAGLSLPVRALAANPPALRQRIIRLAVSAEFGVSLTRGHTLEVARLVTDWAGQGPLHLPGVRVERAGQLIVFSAAAD